MKRVMLAAAAALLSLHAEARVGAGKELAICRTDSGVGGASIVDRRQVARVVPPGDGVGIRQRQGRQRHGICAASRGEKCG